MDATLGEIHMISDFIDIFLYFSGLPPDRAVEFSINIVLGTVPISKPLYSICLVELEEIKDQLNKLETRGFIRQTENVTVHQFFFFNRGIEVRDCILYITDD